MLEPRHEEPRMPASDVHAAIRAVWRIESARLIAGLTRMVRDVGLAEELAREAEEASVPPQDPIR